MPTQPATVIIQLLLGFYLVIVALRFVLELLRVDFRNGLVRTVVRLTAAPLAILRCVVPEVFGVDFAAVALIWLVATAKLWAQFAGVATVHTSGLAVLGFANGANKVLWIFLIAVLARVVLSWVAPHAQHPAARVAMEISEPVMAPFRRMLPAVGGLDLSPMLALFAFHLVQRFVMAPLHSWGVSLLY